MTEFPTELDNNWQMSDELWQQIHPLLLEDSPPKRTGRKRADWRRMIDGVVFRVRTGCKWNKLPKQFGDDSTVHRWYQRWCKSGMIHKVWALVTAHHAELMELTPEWEIVSQAPAAIEQIPAIAGVVGDHFAPVTVPAAQTPQEAVAAPAPLPTVAIAPETIPGTELPVHTSAEAPAPVVAEEPQLPQIAASTTDGHHEPAQQPAAAIEPPAQPYSTEDPHRRAA